VFEYFPGNYVRNLTVVAALNSGGLIDEPSRSGWPWSWPGAPTTTGARSSAAGWSARASIPCRTTGSTCCGSGTSRTWQIPLAYAHRSYEQAVNSPKRSLRIFTPDEGGAEHIGLDHLPHFATFIADWITDTFAELSYSERTRAARAS